MAKFQSPLLGYNNNVRHRNRVFHIQTEDSGVNHPHIITHLFMDGGRILKSVKQSYAEHVGVEGMNETVRGLMKEQHKAMFIALRDGQFDYLVDGGSPPAPKPPAATTEAAAAPVAAPVPAPVVSATLAPATQPDLARTEPHHEVVEVASAEAEAEAPATAPVKLAPRLVLAEPDTDDAPLTTRQPAEAQPAAPTASAKGSVPELTLDLEALEEEDARDGSTPSLFHAADLPPPPKNLFSKGPAYRAVEAEAEAGHDPREEISARVDQREESTAHEERAGAVRAGAAQPAEARYAPARPAAIFGSPQRPPPVSLFSDELVSDKSLDEVILSYLAEDLEPPRRK